MSELGEGQTERNVPSHPLPLSASTDDADFTPDKTAQMMEATKQLPLGGTNVSTPSSPPSVDVAASSDQFGLALEGAYGVSGDRLSAPTPISAPPPIPEPTALSVPAETLAPTTIGHSEPLNSAGGSSQVELIPPSVPNTGWSSMGETPVGPPPQSGLAQGAPKYLPPVAPPGSILVPKATASETKSGRWGWRALTSFVAGGLIAAAGFGAAQLSGADQADGPTSELSATETENESTVTTTAQLLPPVDVEEPAAYVAELLGPAVVQIETDFGVGSGVIYDDGLVLTNHHVVDGARQTRIRLSDGRTLRAELEGSDPNTDIAVISVEKGLDLPIAELTSGEKATVGQVAIAIGSPFQLQQTVTAGIVSAVDRPIPIGNQRVVAMIQTDAPINPGNSGGALADKQGRVIGINTSIQTDGTTSTNAGVGFAVPADTARRIADLLVSGAPIQSGFLGVTGRVPVGGEAGVEIDDVTVDSAAESAGLKVGDRVLSLDGAPVTELAELAGLVLARQAGDTVALEVVRGGETLTIEATLGVREG